ncbi:MAG: polyamine aminopropyltransferase [Nitrospinaceae bacterium]|nr:polyamine aminopropyltransferase [Nitrospinaceae bacterium]MBT3434295.1 polyamine aminopropyltransferase [Nitrospinaceae bacterium]MBT3821644.1 polyamine aminopropyltransferase [Nitrospinaceae bacterium]MBT4429111.1 polyamine aminopropyltransferase [Nitrospinaceae bacterium]MBT5367656.1 polyamine aminopropyltransferase [Nitrospinaceae bacterium]
MWFTEYQSPGCGLTLRVKRSLFSGKSDFQDIQIFDTEDYGRMLVLDGAIQTTERDEFVYHEMIVHTPLCTHPNPKRVLIVGGGDGGCVREVLRHPEVEQVTLVEIDGMVVDLCREYLPKISGKLGDPRVEVRIEDGVKFVRNHKKAFDVIIVDSTDPVNMASPLTRVPFFRAAKEALRLGGLYCCQSQGPLFEARGMRRVARTIRKVFPDAAHYWAHVPTYPGGVWCFAIASKSGKRPERVEPRPLPKGVETRYYTSELHQAAFALPQYVQELLA